MDILNTAFDNFKKLSMTTKKENILLSMYN